MAKYRILTPVKTADGIIHKANEIIELTDKEAAGCLSFKAVAPVLETSQPTQPVVTPVVKPPQPVQVAAMTPNQQKNNVAESQSATETSPKTTTVEDDVVPPESDVR